MNKEELKEKYYRYKHDLMRQRDETKNYYFRKYLNGELFVCDMILDDLQESEEYKDNDKRIPIDPYDWNRYLEMAKQEKRDKND